MTIIMITSNLYMQALISIIIPMQNSKCKNRKSKIQKSKIESSEAGAIFDFRPSIFNFSLPAYSFSEFAQPKIFIQCHIQAKLVIRRIILVMRTCVTNLQLGQYQ